MPEPTPAPPEPHPIPNTEEGRQYLHCGRCLAEWKEKAPGTEGTSPRTYARLQVAWTELGLQVWCVRHECNVLHVDFEGARHPANTTARLDG